LENQYLVSDVLEHRQAFVEDGSVVEDKTGDVSFGINGVEVDFRIGLVGAEAYALYVQVNAGSDGGDECSRTAGNGSVV